MRPSAKAGSAAATTERLLAPADLPGCLTLTAEAGWNQTEDDWRLILGAGKGRGVFLGARLVATAAVLPLGARLGWVCMVLVTADMRRRGLATRLLHWARETLHAQGRTAGLDATPAGHEVYAALGFEPVGTLTRLSAADGVRGVPDSGAARPLDENDLPDAIRLDAAVTGADRAEILRDLHTRCPEGAAILRRDGEPIGYALARTGRIATQIGPVVAEDAATARLLIAQAMRGTKGPVLIDLLDGHPALSDWLAGLGFTVERSFTRMLDGPCEGFGGDPRLVAIAGPELD